jgi:AraC-like DNA-binding protein
MTTFDIVLRSMAAMQLVFLACLLLRRGRADAALRYAALLPAGLAAFMITSAPLPRGTLGAFALPLTLVCVTNPAWFWIFAKAWFDDRFRPALREVAAVVAMAIIGLAHEVGAGGEPSLALDLLFKGAILAFIGMAVVKVIADRRADLVEDRRFARIAFVVAVFVYAALSVALQIAYDGRLPLPIVRANVALLLVVAFALSMVLATATLRRAGSTIQAAAAPIASKARSPVPVDDALIARIREAMETRHLYRDESLTVAALAHALGSQEYRVRRAINQGLGYRNFNEFLHRYRLGEASARLRSQPHLPVLTIALDVGFGSIGPFNRAFRERYGRTPTEYRASGEPSAPLAAAEVRAAD